MSNVVIRARRTALWLHLSRCQLAGEHPSLRELQSARGYRALSTVTADVRYLVKCGLVAPAEHRARAIRVVVALEETGMDSGGVDGHELHWWTSILIPGEVKTSG